MAHTPVPQRWRALATPKSWLSLPLHGMATSARSAPPACHLRRTIWAARFGLMALLPFCLGCADPLFQVPPVPASPEAAGATPDMCLRLVISLPTPSIVAGYAGNMVTFTAAFAGDGSDSVERVQIDYAGHLQRTQSVVAPVLNGTATATVPVDVGHSYKYTARSHGPPVGTGYYCSRFAEVQNITVPNLARH